MGEFRSVQVLDPTLVPDGTTADDFTDSNQTLSVARFAATGNEAKLNLYRKSHSTDVTFDNDHEESSEKFGPPKRPSRSKILWRSEIASKLLSL